MSESFFKVRGWKLVKSKGCFEYKYIEHENNGHGGRRTALSLGDHFQTNRSYLNDVIKHLKDW